MNHTQHNGIISFIWGIADDVLRDVFVRGKYRDVILPMTVLRRLDALLETSKHRVLETAKWLDENNIDDKGSLCSPTSGSGYPFYNTSQWTMKSLLQITETNELERCFIEYLNGFSDNVRDIIDKFRLRDQIKTLREAQALYILLQRFTDGRINLSPQPVKSPRGETIHEGLDNRGMGYVFEELLRRFNEENNEEAGEHFTPRDIIELMTHLVFDPIADKLADKAPYRIYDDACGSGGMLTIAREKLEAIGAQSGRSFNIELFGQEVNPETFAICQSDMMISGQNPDGISYGSTLGSDGHAGKTFDWMMANPPYGKSWKKDQELITDTRSKEVLDARFSQTLPDGTRLRLVPASSDGQLLFTVNMLTKMKTQTPLGSRIAVVHNGSALFTGDAGSGESNIRRWMIENDWLEAIVALPLRMFYNTGIATYIWVFCNKKEARRKGRVQLIDATKQHGKLRKNLGEKSHVLNAADIAAIVQTHGSFEESTTSKLFDNADFGYRKVCIERPLRLKCDLTRCHDDEAFNRVLEELRQNFGDVCCDYTQIKLFAERSLQTKWRAKDWAQFRALCCERDENAEPVYSRPGYFQLEKVGVLIDSDDPKVIEGEIEADPQLRDWENIPLTEDVQSYFAREVLPHVGDAWMDESKTQIGYEISFTRYFYQPKTLRPLSEITREILQLENQTEGLLQRLARELTEPQAGARGLCKSLNAI